MPWTKPIFGSKRFLTSDYLPRSDGRVLPDQPPRCPEAEEGKPFDCEISFHGYRDRKCGPSYNLVIYLCRIHRISFTIYPIGWVPYSRRPLVGEESTFDAVESCIHQKFWPEQANTPTPTRKTQFRWIISWSKLVGVEPSFSDDERVRAANCLGITTISLNVQANRIRAGPTISGRARCISNILLSSPVTLLNSLLNRGFEVGFWGKQQKYIGVIG